MSALNVTQAEAEVLVASLKMLAKVHQSASGVIPSEVSALLDKLAPEVVVAEVVVTPEPVVEVPAEVPAETPAETHAEEPEATEDK